MVNAFCPVSMLRSKVQIMHGRCAVVISAKRATEPLRIFPAARCLLNVVSSTHCRNSAIPEQYADSVGRIDGSGKLTGEGAEISHGDKI